MFTDMFVYVQPTDTGLKCLAGYVLNNKKIIHDIWVRHTYLDKINIQEYFFLIHWVIWEMLSLKRITPIT